MVDVFLKAMDVQVLLYTQLEEKRACLDRF